MTFLRVTIGKTEEEDECIVRVRRGFGDTFELKDTLSEAHFRAPNIYSALAYFKMIFGNTHSTFKIEAVELFSTTLLLNIDFQGKRDEEKSILIYDKLEGALVVLLDGENF